MSKKRVYELAKENNMSSKEFMELLRNLDINVKSNLSVLEDEDLNKINKQLEEDMDYSSYDEDKPLKKEVKKTQKSKSPERELKDQHRDKKGNKAHKTKVRDNNKEKKDTDKKPQGKKEKRDPNHHQETNNRNKNKNKNKDREKKSYSHEKPKRNQPNKKNKRNEKDKKEDQVILIPDEITVRDLAEKIDVPVTQVITKLIDLGIMANQNQDIDYDTAEIVSLEFGKEIEKEESKGALTEDDIFAEYQHEDNEKDLVSRPPVVTVMGHVDHGKTSLLDKIRQTRVQSSEAGGITQHIGASVATIQGEKIVFLDTPGHEAFTQMRMRGAQSTDLAVLVVAADDGVMPQTVEAINHAKAADVPIIVAINKIDKSEANPDRVKQELMEYGLVPEEWGGDTIMVPVSAVTGQGVDDLLEMILMLAEMQELKANPKRAAVGIIIEARLDKGKGPLATVLIQNGSLHQGDNVVSGSASGRIRAMFDDKGKRLKKAGPSMPVQIQGLSDVPETGDHLYAVESEKEARNLADKVAEQKREEAMKHKNVSLDELFEQIDSGQLKDLNVIIKTDVKGTIDAVRSSLEKLSNEEVKVNIVHSAVGGINENDVMLASASNAIIIGFNVRPNQGAIQQAENNEIEIRTYRVIYDAIEDIKSAIGGMLAPEYKEEVLGRAQVRQTFKVPGAGTVAGVYVQSGKIQRNGKARLLRDDVVIYDGDIASLRRFKDDVRELNTGYEGGVGLVNFNDIKEGDEIEAYIMREVKAEV